MEIKPDPMRGFIQDLAVSAFKAVLANPEEILGALFNIDELIDRYNAPDGHRIAQGAIEAHKYGKITTKQAKAVINQFIKDPAIKSAMTDAITVKKR